VAQVNSRIIVRDLGSTNGSFVNGSRVRQEARLRLGDELTIGDVRYRLEQRTRDEEAQHEMDDEPLSSEMPVLLADADSGSDVDASPLKTRRSSIDDDGPMVDFRLAERARSERALADSASF
jgi:pSer/pThr/pTyr-binding forkhead associated (FHA) protein